MSSINEVSRELYTNSIRHIYSYTVLPNLSYSYPRKILEILYTIDLYIKDADQKIIPAVQLSKNLNVIITNFRTVFFAYLLRIKVDLSSNHITNVSLLSDVAYDSQSKFIFDSLFNNLSNLLGQYLQNDSEFYLTKSKESLDALFASLIVGLNDYRSYFKFDIQTSLINYQNVNSMLEETSKQKGEFFNDPSVVDKSIAINSVNINNPVAYNSDKDWRTLFLDLKNKTFDFINQNVQLFYIKNTISSTLESILYSESSNYDSKSNYVTNYTFQGSEVIDTDGIKKIKIDSLVNDSELDYWSDHSLIYYNSNNAYTKSKIISVDKTSKIIRLYPYNGLSSQNKNFTFLSIAEGINIENIFQEFTINKNNSTLFSLQINSGTDTYTNVDFKISDNCFKTNYISFPTAINNPLTNGWILSTQVSGVGTVFFNQGFLLTDVTGTGLSYSPDTYSSNILFYRDVTNNDFILNKKQFNASGTTLYTYFYINDSDKNQSLNVQFDYTVLSKNFLSSQINIEISYFESGREIVLKTLKKLDGTFNKKNNYSDSFTANNSTAYKFRIILLQYVDSFKMSFNNFYIGKGTFNQSSITYSNPKKLLEHLYLSNPYFNNNLIISSNQTNSIDANGAVSISYKMKFSSEPMFTGSKISYKFYNINSNFNWFLSNQTLTGIDPIKITDTGYEKKYYDSFTSLNQKIFNVLNSYALTKLITQDIFNEEEDQFDLGVNVNKKMKSYVNDLLNEFKDNYTFDKDLISDPRSNFLKQGPIDTISARPAQWKKGGLKDVFGLKKFNKFKSQLDKIKSSLKKVKSILEAVKAFIEILSDLIELGEDILGALLNQVITQVEKVVDNIASTGVYWFPIIDYFMVDPTKSNWFKDFSTKLIGYPTIISPFPNEPNITVNNTFLKELKELKQANSIMFQRDIEKQANRVGEEGRGKRWANGIPWLPYRSTTYQEFIQLITSGLLDEGDLPEIGLRTVVNAEGKQETTFRDKAGNPFIFSNSPSVIRPGIPKWTTGSQSMVVVIAICLPAPEDLIAGWEGFLKSLLNILKPIDRAMDYIWAAGTDKKNAGLQKTRIGDDGNDRRNKKLKKLNEKAQGISDEINSLMNDKLSLQKDADNLLNEFKKAQTSEIQQQKAKEYDIKKKQFNELENKINKKDEELKEVNKEIETEKYAVYRNYYFDPPNFLKLSNIIKWIEGELEIQNDYTPPSGVGDIVDRGLESGKDVIMNKMGGYLNDINPFDGLAEWWDESTMVDEIVEERGGRFSGSRGSYPDFLGVSLGSLAPGLFSLAKGFLNKIKKLNKKQSTFNLSEKFQKLIDPIESFIKEIEEMIQMIEDIINAIDAILDINISYLVIKSNNGVPDIINQLENAEGFPNEEKRQIILGGLLGAGIISPTGSEFNFSSYFNEAAEEFKEDKKDMYQDLKNSNEEKGIDFLNKFFN